MALIAERALACWFFVVLLLQSCNLDIVESRYPTLADARADELFRRGWMPDVLPESSHAIRVSNNLDLNYSEGSFRFAPGDAKAFASAMLPGSPPSAPYIDWRRDVTRYRLLGFVDRQYWDGDSTWVFFCRDARGQCDYVMWSARQ